MSENTQNLPPAQHAEEKQSFFNKLKTHRHSRKIKVAALTGAAFVVGAVVGSKATKSDDSSSTVLELEAGSSESTPTETTTVKVEA